MTALTTKEFCGLLWVGSNGIKHRETRRCVFMSIVSPGLRLVLTAVASVVAAALLGGCPWGP
jgi:hypothetical protein